MRDEGEEFHDRGGEGMREGYLPEPPRSQFPLFMITD